MVERTAILLIALALLGCEEESDPIVASTCPTAQPPGERLVVTADWLNGTLTLLGYDRLIRKDCTAAQAIVGTIDLSAYPPGPLEVVLTPDGRRAIVSVAAGFLPEFGIGGDNLGNAGTLLVVDLESRSVVHEIPHAQAPMGVTLHPDGRTAYVAYFGSVDVKGTMMRTVDIEEGTITGEVEVGDNPERVALSADASLGLVTVTNDIVRSFQTSDPVATMSIPLFTGADPSGAAFFETNRVLVANSVSFTVSVARLDDPMMPTSGQSLSLTDAPYGVTPLPGTKTMVVTTMLSGAGLTLVDTAVDPPEIVDQIPLDGGTFPLYAAVDAEGTHAFVAHPYDHVLSVVDLEASLSRGVSWFEFAPGEMPGPSYVAVQP